MNIIVSDNQLCSIKNNVEKLLMCDDHLFIIVELKTEIKSIKGFFGKLTNQEVITNVKMLGYNFKGKFVGFIDESEMDMILSIYDFYQLRNNWLAFKEQLKAFGFIVKKITS